jgi:hypothetical protein
LSPNPTESTFLISLTSSVSVSSVSIVDAFASPIKLMSFGIILILGSFSTACLASMDAVSSS